jgi:hypothetical protein
MVKIMNVATRPYFPALATFVVIVTICLSACNRTPASLKAPNMTSLSPNLQQLFKQTKTVCFSHFVVEVPATATLVYGPAAVDSPIAYFPGAAGKLQQYVAEKLVDVEKHRDYLRKGSEFLGSESVFGKVIDGAMPGQKLVFGSIDHATYSIYSFIPIGNDLFVQSADGAISKDVEIKNLNTVASHLRQRADDEIPGEPGTCIDGGIVSWQPEFEQVTLGIRLKEFPDVHFSIDVVKNQKYLSQSSDLEARLKGAETDGGSWFSRVTFFRRAQRQLGDWKGFEALALKPAQENEKESHEFHFISLGEPNEPLRPRLDIQLDTGASGHHMGAVKPSLSNEEAVALWDKLTSSIRVRPLGGKKSSAAAPPKAPLASLVSTGNACPQAGWWQCIEGDSIEGGRRRHFTVGETMPHAILLGEPNFWQKLTGDRPSHTRITVWKLVDYDEVPTAPSSIADESSPLATLTPVPPLPDADATKDAPPSMS